MKQDLQNLAYLNYIWFFKNNWIFIPPFIGCREREYRGIFEKKRTPPLFVPCGFFYSHSLTRGANFFSMSLQLSTTIIAFYHKLSKVVEDVFFRIKKERKLVPKLVSCKRPYSQVRWFFVFLVLHKNIL